MMSSQFCLIWILQFQVTALALKDIFYVKQNCKNENHQIFCRDINLQNKHLNFEQLNGTYKLYFLRTNLHILEENVFNNIQIEHLSIIGSPLTTIDKNAFFGQEDVLKTLELSTTNRTAITDFTAIQNLHNLETLEIENFYINEDLNNFTSINLTKLTKLSLRNNRIRYFTEDNLKHFKNLPKLRSLSLIDNRIKSLSGDIFLNIPLLEILYLDNQKLTETMEIKWLRNTSGTLKRLSLKGNNFNDTDLWAAIRTLPHLEFLDLSKCNLEKIPVFAFEHNLKLEVIKLNDNRIQTLEEGAFEGLQNCLEYIELINNQLQVIDECVFNNFNWPKTRAFHIDLTNNKLICNCSLHWLQILMQESINKSNDNYFYFKNWWCHGMNGKEIIYSTDLNCELKKSKTDCEDFGVRDNVLYDEDTLSSRTKLETSSVHISLKSFERPNISIKLERVLPRVVKISWKISDLFWVKDFILEILEIFPNQESNKTLIPIHKSTQFYTYYYLNPHSILHVCIIVNVTAKSNLIDACGTLRPKEQPSSLITNNKHTKEIVIGVGVSVSVLVLVILLFLLYRQHKQNKQNTYEEPKSPEKPQDHFTPASRYDEKNKPNDKTNTPTVPVVAHDQLRPISYLYWDNPSFKPDHTYEEIQTKTLPQYANIPNAQNYDEKKEHLEDLCVNNLPYNRQIMTYDNKPLPHSPVFYNNNTDKKQQPHYVNVHRYLADSEPTII